MPKVRLCALILLLVFFGGSFASRTAHAEEGLAQDIQIVVKAKVLEVLAEEARDIPGTETKTNFQTLKVEILEGDEKGKEVTVENDYLNLKKGEVFYLVHIISAFDGRDYYSVGEPYRLPALLFFTGLFVLCVFIFGGLQGIRGLLSLVLSFFFIAFLLFPGILRGYSPIVMSIGVSSLIIILGSYITHGFNKTTTSAVVGMVVTIIFTGFLAYFAVDITRLSGFSSEEAVYLNFNTQGSIDFVGLLFGGIIIGLLGVLYDAAIGQAIAVEELHRVGPHLSRSFIFKRALRIGREHIGALVDTLAIAYVGVSLPLLLLFYSSSTYGLSVTLSREVFATEIIRTMIGSIGLILAVPITTFFSALILVRDEKKMGGKPELGKEIAAVEEASHHH